MDAPSIRNLYEAQQRAWNGWRSRPDGYATGQAASQAFRDAAEALRQRFPFQTSAAYAYSPRENVGSTGGNHILCCEDVSQGRFRRRAGDALCKPASKFWGLTELDQQPSCLRCLEIAEKLSR